MDSSIRPWLRLEGAAAFLVSAVLFAGLEVSGWWFAALFFAPDLAMLGYLGGARLGARVYNGAHTYVAPAALAAPGAALAEPLVLACALIWAAHIGFDRMLGYGLKLPSGFQDTHLGRIGRGAKAAAGPKPRQRVITV